MSAELDIEGIYIALTVLWIVLIFWLQLYQTDIIGIILLLLPILAFAISFYNINNLDDDCEDYMGKFNIIAFVLFAATVLINWHRDYPNQIWIRSLVVIGALLLVISKIDLWVSREDRVTILHFRIGLQNLSLTIIAFALYEFYREIAPLGIPVKI